MIANSGIYKIQSKVKPERIYIGSSINIANRWKQHLNSLCKNIHRSPKLQNHYNKYGVTDLTFSILLGCDKEDLVNIEQYFMDTYKPYFNINPNAKNRLGAKLSEEAKKKIGLKSKGRTAYFKGKKLSEDHKLKLKLAWAKRKPVSEETKRKISLASKGRKMSDEFRQKIKDSWIIRKQKRAI